MKCENHGTWIIIGLPPRNEPRCHYCGHRVSPDGKTQPRQSRELPPWTWPGELIGRRRAKRWSA